MSTHTPFVWPLHTRWAPPAGDPGPPAVDTDPETLPTTSPEESAPACRLALLQEDPERDELLALLDWWYARQRCATQDSAPVRKRRATYHVKEQLIERVRQEAQCEGVSSATIVNLALEAYLTGRPADERHELGGHVE